MGLFSRRREEETKNQTTNAQPTVDSQSTRVESVSANREELNKLLSEFRSMQSDDYGQNAQPQAPAEQQVPQPNYSANYTNEQTENYVPTQQESVSDAFANRVTSQDNAIPHDTVEEGDKYSLSAEDTFQIEKYLLGGNEEEEEPVVLPAEDALEDEDLRPEQPVQEQYQPQPMAEQPASQSYADQLAEFRQTSEPVVEEEVIEEEEEEYYEDTTDTSITTIEEYNEDEEVEEEVEEEYSQPTQTYAPQYEEQEEVIEEEYQPQPIAEQPASQSYADQLAEFRQASEPVAEEEVVDVHEEPYAPETITTEENSYVEEEPEDDYVEETPYNTVTEESTPLNINDVSTPYNVEEEVARMKEEYEEDYSDEEVQDLYVEETPVVQEPAPAVETPVVDEVLAQDEEDIEEEEEYYEPTEEDFAMLENLKLEVEEQEMDETINSESLYSAPETPVQERAEEPQPVAEEPIVEEPVLEEPKVEEEPQVVAQPEPQPVAEQKTTEQDLDAKLNERFSAFEEKLIAKILATMGSQAGVATQVNPAMVPKKPEVDPDLDVEFIDTTAYKGEVKVFEPLEKIKKASWEDVVRRKGHYAYHITAAANGGWWIKRARSSNPFVYAEDKDEALQIGIIYAKREKAELKLHDKKGVIEKSMSFGREKKIN